MTGDLFNKMQGNVIMCGFVGYITCVTDDSCFGAKAAISREHQQKALDTLEYRGPDAEGQWQDQHVWLGHRRLSIVDTGARGNQPMEYGNLVIAFNGMIYNFRDIRQSLFKKAINFIPKPTQKLFLPGGLNGNRIYCRACKACLLLCFGTRPQNVWFWRVIGSAKNRFITGIGVMLLLLDHVLTQLRR